MSGAPGHSRAGGLVLALPFMASCGHTGNQGGAAGAEVSTRGTSVGTQVGGRCCSRGTWEHRVAAEGAGTCAREISAPSQPRGRPPRSSFSGPTTSDGECGTVGAAEGTLTACVPCRIVCVGGDGMFSEVLHGLIGRTQRNAGVDQNQPRAALVPSPVRIGIIPAGRGAASSPFPGPSAWFSFMLILLPRW